MFSKCPKISGLKISSNNDFTFCPNPGNHSLIISLAAPFFSCVSLFLYPFLLSLTWFPVPESALYPFCWSLPNPFGGHWSRTKEEEMTAPSAIPHHSAMSLPLGFLLHTNLITCLTAQLWTACAPCPGLMGYSVPHCTAQEGMMTALLGKGAMDSKRSAPLTPGCYDIMTQHCSSKSRFFPRRWLPFSSNEGSPLFCQNF